jgi:ATP/maltotriose-dependent transcriptional regulator MalT
LAYLIESLRIVEPDIGGRALAAHSAPGAGPVDVVLPLLLNDAAALETGIVLVLDDYHVMEWRFAMTKLEHAARPEAKKVDLAATARNVRRALVAPHRRPLQRQQDLPR